MNESGKALENLDLLYGTLDDPGRWSEWLDHTCNLLRADGANISLIPQGHDAQPTLLLNCLSADELDTYIARFIDKDFLVERWSSTPVGEVRSLGDVSTDFRCAYLDSEFYQEFAVHTCCRMQLGAPFYRGDGWTAHIGVHRYDLDDPFGPSECSSVAGLLSHLRRVLEQQDYVGLLEDAVATLGGFGHGIFLIDGAGRVQYANAMAARVVRDGWLRLEDRLLSTNCPTDTVRLHSMLGELLSRKPDEFPSGGEFFVSRAGHPLPLILSVAPNCRRVPFKQTQSEIKAVVTVIDPIARRDLEQRMLRSLYGLTGREVAVCELLLQGDSLRTIGERLQIAYETVRQHLKSICRKVRVRSQPQLIALLAALSR